MIPIPCVMEEHMKAQTCLFWESLWRENCSLGKEETIPRGKRWGLEVAETFKPLKGFPLPCWPKEAFWRS